MTNRWIKPIFLTLFILLSALLGFIHLGQMFEQYQGTRSSALAPIIERETVEVAGTFISENRVDLKEIIRTNQSKVVQIEREDGELGSGFLYNDKGDIITNAHIVGDASTVLVRMPNTQTYYGTVIGVGEVVDVAVVRVQELEKLEPMSIAFE